MLYDPQIDLNDDTTMSHTLVIRMVGADKNVLDVGCARGNMGRILAREFGCTVSGIEIDPEAAALCHDIYQQVVIGDIEELTPFEQLRNSPFNVIIFSNILEHLKNAEIALEAAKKLLHPKGYVLVSLPNVVTLRLRLGFLLGKFEYTEQGIMDRTHLHFFTLKTATEMFQSCGYQIVAFDYLVGPRLGKRLKKIRFPRRLLPPTIFGTEFIFKLKPMD